MEIAPIELGGGGTNPEGIWGWLLGKNNVLMEEGQGLTGGGLIKAFRTSDIFKNYRLNEEVLRRTTYIDSVTRTESDLDGQSSRGDFPTYLRSISRILQNEFNDQQSSIWGPADTYDHTRRIPKIDRYNGRKRRNYSGRTTHRRNRPTQYRNVNCPVGDEVGEKQDNEDYDKEAPGNSDYHGGSCKGPSVIGSKR